VQAATARAAPTARPKDPCRIDLDRVVLFVSEGSSGRAEENLAAGDDADIFISISRVLGGRDARMLTKNGNENPIFVAFGIEGNS
jgi:hypothetical protein